MTTQELKKVIDDITLSSADKAVKIQQAFLEKQGVIENRWFCALVFVIGVAVATILCVAK